MSWLDGKSILNFKNDSKEKRNKIATNFFKKANQENKIKTIVGPALESINDFKKNIITSAGNGEQKFSFHATDAAVESYISLHVTPADAGKKKNRNNSAI